MSFPKVIIINFDEWANYRIILNCHFINKWNWPMDLKTMKRILLEGISFKEVLCQT